MITTHNSAAHAAVVLQRPPATGLRRPSRRPRPSGFTLVELLVVIGILTVLAGIALPIFRNTIKDQKKTQAARQLVTYIEAARSRAIASKGRVGVMITRRGVGGPLERSYSTQVQLSVAYPPYAGESDNARAILYHDDAGPMGGTAGVANAALFDPTDNTLLEKARMDYANGRGALAPIREGDPIQFGESGRSVLIQSITRYTSSGTGDPLAPTDRIKITFDPRGVIPSPGAIPMHDFPTSLMSVGTNGRLTKYKIFRDPVGSAASPLDMLRGMAIDLNFSGIGRDGAQFSPMVINPSQWDSTDPVNFQSVLMMFGPDGRIEYCASGVGSGRSVTRMDYRPTGMLYFCLGRADGVVADPTMMFSDTDRERSNIMDPESIWVVVNPFNGNVFAAPSASPAAAVATLDSSVPIGSQLGAAVWQSRQFAFEADELTSL